MSKIRAALKRLASGGSPDPTFPQDLEENPYGYGPAPEARSNAPGYGGSRDPMKVMDGNFEDEQAKSLSPTMGGYGMGQLAGEAYQDATDPLGPNWGELAKKAPFALGIFAGPGARTADRTMLARAREMTTQGAHRDAVWNETGWFQGPEGKWRFEIPDDGAKFKNQPTNTPDWGVRPRVLSNGTTTDDYEVYHRPTGPQGGFWGDVQYAARHVDRLNQANRIGDVFHHPELFEAYPELADRPFSNSPPQTSVAAYNPDTRGIAVSREVPSNMTRDGVALHELQHAVQHDEGFAPGSNLTIAMDSPEAKAAYDARVEAAQREYQEANDAYKLSPTSENLTRASTASYILSKMPAGPSVRDAIDVYKRTAGEVEARNVEERRELPEDLRQRLPPWSTQDIPDKDVILSDPRVAYGEQNAVDTNAPFPKPNINTKPFPKPGNLEELADSFKNREDAPGLLDYDSYMNSEPTTVGINHDYPAPNDFPAREKLNQPLKNLRHPATRDRLARQATPNLFESPQGTLVNPWYDPAPLLDMWKRYWGDEHAETELGRYLDNVAATSPLTEVGHNLREASVPYSLHHQGRDLSDTALMDISGLAAKNKRNMIRTVAAGEPLNPSSAPKVASFQANLRGAGVKEPSYDAQGNRITTPITLDTVMAKTWPYRTAQGDQALFKKSSYGAGVDAGHHLAENLGGVPGADWQAAVWQGQQKSQHADTSYGARYNDSFARQLETAVHQKAAREGIDPQRMWEEFVLGRKPLFADGGDVGEPEPSDFEKVLASNPHGWGPEPEARGTGPGESRDPFAAMDNSFEDQQAQALSPTMGAYGAGQTGREVYDKLHEGDWKGSIEAAAPLIAMAMFPGPKGARLGREAGALPEAAGGAKGYGAQAAGVREPGGVQRGEGALAPRDRASDPYAPLLGIPRSARVPGHGQVDTTPIPWLVDTVNDYMKKRGTAHELPEAFGPFDAEQAKRIAQAYEEMEHNPGDPRVRQAYEAMREETIGQYRALRDAGANFRYYTDYKDNPYADSPAMGFPELRDKRSLAIFPTEAGYGNAFTPSELENNPLLKSTSESLGDRKDVPLNDLFRAVHDAYGHYAYGNAYFRDKGEDRAYLIHSGMYSPEARAGIAPELRGQNSWVNWGPHGEHNRSASEADTIFAPQKIGRLPEWAVEGGREGITKDTHEANQGDWHHGTDAAFDKFDPRMGGSVHGSSDSDGVYWLTRDPARASQAARDAMDVSGVNAPHFPGGVLKARANMRNPMTVNTSLRDLDPLDSARLIAEAKAKGHDAVLFPHGEGNGADVAAWHPDTFDVLKSGRAGGGPVTRAVNVLKRAFGGVVADDDE